MNRFLSELRRRKVFRTAAGYLAAAFVALQVADLTFEPLGLSADAYRAFVLIIAVGFPVAVLLSWFLEIRSESNQPNSDVVSTRTTRKATFFVAAFLVLATSALAWYSVNRWREAEPDGTIAVAVLPFDVIGDPQLEYLETGIVEMISRNIDGAGRLRAIAPEMVISAASRKSAGVAPAQSAVAKTLGARYIVSGNIARAADSLRVTLTVQDFERSDAKPVRRDVKGAANDLFGLIDRVSAQVLAATRRGEDAQLTASAAQTTSSLPALRAYLEGEEFYRKTRYDSAVAHFGEAVALDSTFALAYYRLAIAQIGMGGLAAARSQVESAVAHSERLAPRERKLVQTFADAFNGKWRASIDAMQRMLEKYPNDLELMYNSGIVQLAWNPRHGRSIQEVAPLIDRVAAADPEFLCPI